MKLIEVLIVLLTFVLTGYGVVMVLRRLLWAPNPPRWTAEYTTDGQETIWWVMPPASVAVPQPHEPQKIARFASDDPNFDELFHAGEFEAHQRAAVLNGTLPK
jgi:hypothetical protein